MKINLGDLTEEEVHLYEHYFNIEHSDTWSLNDLLQYALELIISDEEDCVPSDISEDLRIARKYMLNEIDNAIQAQRKNKAIPPMPIVASNISRLGAFLRKDELSKVEELLNCEYRRKRGIKKDAAVTKQDDIERLFNYRKYNSNLSRPEAIEKLAQREKIDDRSAERAIKRGKEYLQNILRSAPTEMMLDRLELLNLLRCKMIKNEIQRLLSYSDESTREDHKSEAYFNKLIKEIQKDTHQDT